jgi:polyhydroxyalkanoate synthesis regulator phasin
LPVVTIKLDEKEYKELKEKAVAAGYESVSEYIKSLIHGGAIESQGIEEEIPPKFLRAVQDMINPFTAKVDEIARKLGELSEKVEGLEERLSGIERSERTMARSSYTRGARRRVERKSAIERLREEGVVFQKELSWLNNPEAFFNKLKREGAVVIEARNELIAVDHDYWNSFVDRVSRIREEDLNVVEKKLEGKMKELFRKLVDNGNIFYDKLEKRWSVSV